MNLFLALLLSNFGSSSLSAPAADQDTNKIAEAFDRIGRFKGWVKQSILNALKSVKNKLTNQISDQPPGERTHHNSWIWNEGFYPLVTTIYHFSICPSPILYIKHIANYLSINSNNSLNNQFAASQIAFSSIQVPDTKQKM